MTNMQLEKQLRWLMIESESLKMLRFSNLNEMASLFPCSTNISMLNSYAKKTGKIFLETDTNFYINADSQLVTTKTTVDQPVLATLQHAVDTMENRISNKLLKIDCMFLVGVFYPVNDSASIKMPSKRKFQFTFQIILSWMC